MQKTNTKSRAIERTSQLKEISKNEAASVGGGIVPLLGVMVAAGALGYQIGKDLAQQN